MDFVRSDNWRRIDSRATRSVVRAPPIDRAFEKLGAHHWRTRARVSDKSSLVELVRLSAVRCTGLDLDEHQNTEKRRARRWRRTYLRPSRRHVFAHHLAGALELFFCFDFCDRASGVARANQIRLRSLDCIR